MGLLGCGPRLEEGIAEIIERSRVLTTSDELKIAATSGSNTIATVPSDIFAANRFGFDLLYSNRYSERNPSRFSGFVLRTDVFFIVFTFSTGCFPCTDDPYSLFSFDKAHQDQSLFRRVTNNVESSVKIFAKSAGTSIITIECGWVLTPFELVRSSNDKHHT